MIVHDSQQARERAASHIKQGGVVAFRTDTFYGLGADPFNDEALRRINELKGRDGKPILIIISDAREADRLIAGRSEIFDLVAARHWPGALTIVLSARDEVPVEITAGTGTVGVRLPDDASVREFVRACGGALTATSANRAGESPARTAQEVADAFPNGLDLIVDSGATRADKPSTVIDLCAGEARLIREGAVSLEKLRETMLALGLELK
ncbi:MAG: L-threonylcarbamoyladenylate synthase [Pyrinomonadaceae bacterium]